MSYNKYLEAVVRNDMRQSSEPTHIYVDLCAVNNDYGTKPPSTLTFTDSRDAPYVKDPSDYFFSVIRFHIDTNTLPAMIPQIQPNQDDINKTIYSFTLTYKTYEFQQFLEFMPQDLTCPLPKTPNQNGGVQDVSTGYYFLQNYSFFVKLLNATLDECYLGLKNIVEEDGDTLPSNYAPFIVFDNSSGELIFNCDAAAYDSSLSNPINIYLNTAMQVLLSGFGFLTFSHTDGTGKNYKLLVVNDFNTNVLELEQYNAIQIYQEYNSTSGAWSCVQSVVIVSTTLPVSGTLQSAPKQFNSLSNMNNKASNFSLNIISDFQVVSQSKNDWKPSVNYVASGNQYRFLDLYGHTSINSLSFEIYFRDIYNNFYPVTLASSCNANLKILFRAKNLGV